MNENSGKEVLVQLNVSDPVETEQPGRFETRLTHPNLVGELVLTHGAERDALLSAIGIDVKAIDPVGALFRGLRELRQ